MSATTTAANTVKQLEDLITRLLERNDKLEQENTSLLNRQESLVSERAGLLAKNEQARVRVEAMINRLKSLEQA